MTHRRPLTLLEDGARVGAQALALVVASALAYLSVTSDLEAVEWAPPRPLPDLAPNSALVGAQRLFADDMLGPESLALGPDQCVYTGTMDGRILKFSVDPGSPEYLLPREFARFNASCGPFAGSYDEYPPAREPLCGRPLGMRFDASGRLLVAEAYSGLHRFSSDGAARELLLDNVRGKPIRFANDLDVAGDGTVYLSVSSDRWGRDRVAGELLSARRCGVVVALDPDAPAAAARTLVVWDDLPFTNGVTLSHDRASYVYFVAGPAIHRIDRESGASAVALDNLPCVADNIRRRAAADARFLVACASRRSAPFALLDALAPYPSVRNLLHALLPARLLLKFVPRMGLVLDVDLSPGRERVVRLFQDRSAGGVAFISEAEELPDGYTYMGTWHERGLARVKTDVLQACGRACWA